MVSLNLFGQIIEKFQTFSFFENFQILKGININLMHINHLDSYSSIKYLIFNKKSLLNNNKKK